MSLKVFFPLPLHIIGLSLSEFVLVLMCLVILIFETGTAGSPGWPQSGYVTVTEDDDDLGLRPDA